ARTVHQLVSTIFPGLFFFFFFCVPVPPSESRDVNRCSLKIVQMSNSKAGKHGHVDITTDKKHQNRFLSTYNMDVPCIKKKDYQLDSISGIKEVKGSLKHPEVEGKPILPRQQTRTLCHQCFSLQQSDVISLISRLLFSPPSTWSLVPRLFNCC
uniref:Uncharacterized protein n=1 Tax=Poecilia latipinna TaxID=48699 RepID=A0A3B3V0Y8_9TELE